MALSLALALATAPPQADLACARAGVAVENQRFAELQNLRLAYVRCGEGAPTVVFEMGFGGNLGAMGARLSPGSRVRSGLRLQPPEPRSKHRRLGRLMPTGCGRPKKQSTAAP